MADPIVESYDQVPYESIPVPEAHPEVLAVSARLMGLHPPDPARCRVLELGCADGGNLVPIALALPDARLVGIDLSPLQIADGQGTIESLGIRNLRLEARSILDVDASFGTFDYILCHGVFSWVPVEVREKVLSICRDNLSPDGVAYVSYNTYPGWHLRGLFRDILSWGTRSLSEPRERIERSRALLPFLARAVGDPDGIYGRLFRQEAELLEERPDSYVFHEHLEDLNHPLHVHEFIAAAARHGLRFLCEARLANVGEAGYPRFREALSRLASNPVEREQYLDILLNRTFRRSLLTHAAPDAQLRLAPEAIAELLVECDFVGSPAPGRFTTRDGGECGIGDPLLRSALELLAAEAPRPLTYAELSSRLDLPQGPGPLCHDLLECYMRSLVELRVSRPALSTGDSATPRAYPPARLQAARGQDRVSTPRHRAHEIAEVTRLVLASLDGTRTRTDVVAAVSEAIGAGDFDLEHDGRSVTEPSGIRAAVEEMLPGVLRDLSRAGLLVS